MPRTAVQVSTYQTPQKIWVKQTWIQILEASSLVDLTYLLLPSSSSTASHSPLYLSPPPYVLLDGGFSPTVVYLECYLTHTQYITLWISHHCLYLAVLLLVSPSVTHLNSLVLYKSHVPIFLCFLSPLLFLSSWWSMGCLSASVRSQESCESVDWRLRILIHWLVSIGS